MSGLIEGLRAAMRAFDALHGEGAAARELLGGVAIFAGAAILAIAIAAIGKGL